MKNLLFLIVTVFYICSCTSKPDGYEVTIDLKNAKNEQIYVSDAKLHMLSVSIAYHGEQ